MFDFAPRVPDQALDLALMATLARPPEAISEHIMRLHFTSIFATVSGSISKRRAASRRLSPPRTPLVEPARKFHPLHPTAHLCRFPANGVLLPDFYSAASGLQLLQRGILSLALSPTQI